MQFTVNKDAMMFLFHLIRNPQGLPVHLLGQGFQHYRAADIPAAREIVSMQNWMRKCQENELKDVRLGEAFTHTFNLKKTYVTRLLHMLDHYKDFGRMAETAEGYLRLRDALEGKDFEASLDDPTGD